MSDFKAERFRVYWLPNAETYEKEEVLAEVSLQGLKLLTPDGRLPSRIYPLKNITQWELRGETVTLYTKNSVDVEERQVTLTADKRTCQLLLDTLTSFYYQKDELMQSSGVFGTSERGLRLSSERSSRKQTVPSQENVEFWNSPEKEGWLFSQGEVIKTWRRRWFILKSGFLFRFLNNDVGPSVKPRGIVDLSTVTDITSGTSTTGKQHSLKLSTASGYVCYCADSETDLVEWMSALEKAHTEILKRVAGVEEEEKKRRSSVPKSRRNADMVSVLGYSDHASAPPVSAESDLALNYGDIAGISRPKTNPPNPTVNVDYSPGEIPQLSLYPSPVAPPAYSSPALYNGSILDQAPQQTPSYPSFQSISAPDYSMQVPMSVPNQWQAFSTPDGRVYYHNSSTGVTQWERPHELAA